MTVPGQRGRNEHLTDPERKLLRFYLMSLMTTDEIALAMGCSSRVIQKYRSLLFPHQRITRERQSSYYQKKPQAPEPIQVSRPHMLPWVTMEMLTSGRAKPARCG